MLLAAIQPSSLPNGKSLRCLGRIRQITIQEGCIQWLLQSDLLRCLQGLRAVKVDISQTCRQVPGSIPNTSPYNNATPVSFINFFTQLLRIGNALTTESFRMFGEIKEKIESAFRIAGSGSRMSANDRPSSCPTSAKIRVDVLDNPELPDPYIGFQRSMLNRCAKRRNKSRTRFPAWFA